MAIEQPSFRVLEQDGAFELREYAPHLLVETRVDADFECAGNVAFQMTAPVTQTSAAVSGEKIAMTTPVAQQADRAGCRVAF